MTTSSAVQLKVDKEIVFLSAAKNPPAKPLRAAQNKERRNLNASFAAERLARGFFAFAQKDGPFGSSVLKVTSPNVQLARRPA